MRFIIARAATIGLVATCMSCSPGDSGSNPGAGNSPTAGDRSTSGKSEGSSGSRAGGGSQDTGSAGAGGQTARNAGGGSSAPKGAGGSSSNAAGTSQSGGRATGTNAGGAAGAGQAGASHAAGTKVADDGGAGASASAGTGGAAGSTKTTDKADATCTAVLDGDVHFSTPSGTFKDSLSVTLSTTLAGAEIRYTIDGTAPTSSSSSYTAPLAVSKTTRVRATAFVDGAAAGEPSAALYVARAEDLKHDLPVIVLDSYGSGKLPTQEEQRKFVDVAFLEFDPVEGSTSLSATPTVSSLAAFHVRGNSSAMFDKVPYRLELRDAAGEDRDCPVVGMPADSDWALVGPHADKTLVHNNFVYDLGRELGLQVPRVKLVEAYINVDGKPLSASHYQGVYQVVETIKDNKNRLNLKKLKPTKISDTELTGGYIFKFEWQITGVDNPITCPTTASNCWAAMYLVDPDPYAPEQLTWLTNHLVSFNTALHGTDLANASTGYPNYLETKSFLDTIIINEFTRNLDSYVRSQYFYKDRGEKINAGPLWDFDCIAGVGLAASGTGGGGFPGMGGGSSMANTAADGWQYEANSSRLKGATADWIPILVGEPGFKTQLVARWKELRQSSLSDASIASRIDTVSQGLANAADRNFKKWNILSSAKVQPFDTPTDATWAAQISSMKTWLQKRAAWLDGQWK